MTCHTEGLCGVFFRSCILFQVKDLLIFMAVLFIVLIAYGVTSSAILQPKDSFYDINMLRDPIWQPYFKIYGVNLVDRDPANSKLIFS